METPRSGFSMVLIFAGTHGKGCAVAMAPPRPVLSPRVPRLAAGAVVPIVFVDTPETPLRRSGERWHPAVVSLINRLPKPTNLLFGDPVLS